MAITPIYIGADHLVTYSGASAGGSYLNTGTCTYTLYNSAGGTVGSGTLSYVAASNGNYQGTIESTVTSGLTLDSFYVLEVSFSQGAYQDLRRLNLQAQYRQET